MTNSNFPEIFERRKNRRSGPKCIGGRQNVNRPSFVDIHDKMSSPVAARKLILEDGPLSGVTTEMDGWPPPCGRLTVTSSNSSDFQSTIPLKSYRNLNNSVSFLGDPKKHRT